MNTKHIILLCALLAQGLRIDAQVIMASWTSVSSTSNPTIPANDDGQSAHLSASDLSVGMGVTANTGGSYNWRSWNATSVTEARSLGEYFEWSVTAISGVDVNNLSIKYDRSPTGPQSMEIHASTDGFASAGTVLYTDPTVSTSGENALGIPLGSLGSVTPGMTLTFRLYAFGATQSAGTFDLENFGANTIELTASLLPVTLSHFDGSVNEENEVTLEWETHTEIDNDYFAIDRSVDGVNFTELIRIAGQGSHNNSTKYSYVDPDPRQGLNYYRLRQVDFDGSENSFRIIPISVELKTQLRVFPTLVDHYLNIQSSRDNVPIRIIGYDGQTYHESRVSSREVLNMSTLAPGYYYIILESESYPFIKQ